MQDVEKVIKRSRQYWYVDGITELCGGISIFLLGIFQLGIRGIIALKISYAYTLPPQSSPDSGVLLLYDNLILILWLLWVCSVIIVPMIGKRLKERFTYPRVGYLAPRTFTLQQHLIEAIKLIVLLAVIFFTSTLISRIMSAFESQEFMLTSTSSIVSQMAASNKRMIFVGIFLTSFIYIYPAIKLALTRFYILTAVSVLMSIVLFQTRIVETGTGLGLYQVLMGIALIISGGITFRNFLHQYPLPKEELE